MGFAPPPASALQRWYVMPTENSLGSYVGRLTRPSTLPSRGSSATAAPRLDVRHRRLERLLHLEVEGEHEVVARHRQLRRSLGERRDAAAGGVHDHELRAVLAAQHVLVAALDAAASDQVAGPVTRRRERVELAVVDLAGVAEQVGRERAVRVAAQRLDLDVDPGQLVARLLDRGAHDERRVASEHRRLPGAVRLRDQAMHLGRVPLDQRRHPPRPVRALDEPDTAAALGRERPVHDVEAGRAVGEQLTMSIVDRPARRAQHLETNVVLLRQLAVFLVLGDLEPNESNRDRAEAREHDAGEHPAARLSKSPYELGELHG